MMVVVCVTGDGVLEFTEPNGSWANISYRAYYSRLAENPAPDNPRYLGVVENGKVVHRFGALDAAEELALAAVAAGQAA